MSTGEYRAGSAAEPPEETLKYYFRLKQGSRDAPGDSQQFPLPGKDPHSRRLAEFGQVDRGAVADPGRALLGGDHSGKLRQYQARMKEHFIQLSGRRGLFHLLQTIGLVY